MKTTQPEEPAKRPQPTPDRGSPASTAAHAVRKDAAVRVAASTESDELREHGYGHGV